MADFSIPPWLTRLANMLPSASGDAIGNRIWMNPKHQSQFNPIYSLPLKFSDHFNFSFVEQCIISFGALFPFEPSFFNRILGIVFVSAKKKMIRIATFPIVTKMTNAHPFWYWPLFQFKRYTMSEFFFAIPIRATISIGVSMPHPRPAFFWFSNSDSRPKSIFCRWLFAHTNFHPESAPCGIIFRSWHDDML